LKEGASGSERESVATLPVASVAGRIPGEVFSRAKSRYRLFCAFLINSEGQMTPTDDLPNIRKAEETQLAAWPVISSILFDVADSDTLRLIVDGAGLDVDWSLSTEEAYSNRTRNRAYRPKIDKVYKSLSSKDQDRVLSIISAELSRRYPQQASAIKRNLSRIGWTIITAAETFSGHEPVTLPMKRDKELQRLLLLQLRDGKEPAGLSGYSETDQVYNAALLINDGLVEGEAIQDGNGLYVSTVMTHLTSLGHNFLETAENTGSIQLPEKPDMSEVPTEIVESLKRFRLDYPGGSRSAFVMMRFGKTKAHAEIIQGLRDALASHGIKALRADDKDYHDDLFWNILTYIYGCDFGIAVFERIEQEEFNPNIALEVGYMMGLKKPVLLLKDKTLKSLTTDLIGRLYKVFDPQSISASLPPEVDRWLKDRDLIPKG
jgi:hypothetical protein